jgi:hypothetical protein
MPDNTRPNGQSKHYEVPEIEGAEQVEPEKRNVFVHLGSILSTRLWRKRLTARSIVEEKPAPGLEDRLTACVDGRHMLIHRWFQHHFDQPTKTLKASCL